MDSYIDVDLLDRYLAGTCSARERSAVEQWLAADPARSLAALAGGTTPYPDGLGDRDAAWARIARSIHTDARADATVDAATDTASRHVERRVASSRSGLPTIPSWRHRDGRRWRGAAMAAAIATCVGLFAIGFAWRDRAPDDRSVSRVYATTTGQRATLTLSDGSQVTLAPRTTLRIDPAFGRDTRTVALDGEAIFHVASRRAAPFLVRTGAVTTRVLGTTFDVRHYANDLRVQVAVVEGKVVSGGRAGAITLAAGMVGEISDSTTALRADSAA
jgi:ferric-dicitrate binding protein FerR (iron transport regulator)